MSSGYSAAHAWVIKWEKVKELIPRETKQLEDILKSVGADIDDFCKNNTWNMPEDLVSEIEDTKKAEKIIEEIQELWNNVKEKFQEVTGLEIDFNYHDQETEGSIYDDVDGGFFTVDGVTITQLTEAGRKYEKDLTESFWVNYG